MGGNTNTSTILIVLGLSLSVIGLIAIEDDLDNWVEKLRMLTVLSCEWWNVVMVVIGLCMAGYGAWLYACKHLPADGGAEDTEEHEFSLFQMPILYPVIWFKKFEALATAGKEDDSVRTARIIDFMFVRKCSSWVFYSFSVLRIMGDHTTRGLYEI